MYADKSQMKSWVETYGKFYLYAIETGVPSNTLEKARWLADIFARRHMDDQFGGGIKPNGMNEIQVIFERVFLFGISIDVALDVRMEELCDARRWALEMRKETGRESDQEPYGEEIMEAMEAMRRENLRISELIVI